MTATITNPECIRVITQRQDGNAAPGFVTTPTYQAIANPNNAPHKNKPINPARTHRPNILATLLRAPLAMAGRRHLLTPLAVVAMLLGLASNAGAQDTAPDFGETTVPDQTYYPRQMLDITLPAATGGDGVLTYTLIYTPTSTDSVTLAESLPEANLNPITRVLSGTLANNTFSARLYTYTATDADNDTDSLTFNIRVTNDRAPVFAEGVSIADKFYLTDETVAQTLPVVAGGSGNTAIVYALTPALPAGLSFDAVRRPPALLGTLTTVFPTTIYTYTATDTDSNTAPSDSDSLEFTITVGADAAPAFAAGAMITTQAYTQHTMITPLTFPQATGGNDPLTYTLTTMGSLLGLTFNAAARPPTLTGTPNIFGVRDLVYKVTDADSNTATGDTATLPFRITVAESETALNFPTAIGVGAQPAGSDVRLYYLLGQAITPITFPTATGGTGPYTYETVSGAPPPELTFDGSVRVLAGTPTAPGRSTFTYRVTDSATPAAMADVSVTMVICENGGATDGATVCPVPTFVTLNLPTPADQVFINIRPITPLTLPAATGGTGTNPVRIYTATPLPAGLSFNPASRVISGRPEAESTTTTTVNYRVGDAGQGNADTQSTTVTFDIVVGDRLILIDPTTETFTVGETVAYTLPVAQRGTPPFTYTLTMTNGGDLNLPAGLTWNMGVTPQTITGIPTTPTPETGYNYTVTDSLGLSTSGSFDFTVNADTAPDFGETTVPDQTYYPRQMLDITLPAATGGDGVLTYTLIYTPTSTNSVTLAESLPEANLNPITRVLSGTLANNTFSARLYTYTATDADNDTDSLTFNIRVTNDRAPVFAEGVSIADKFYLTDETVAQTLPVVAGGSGNTAIVYALTPALPAGLSFDAVRRPPALLGTLTTVFPTTIYTYTATDTDSNTAPSDSDSLEFTITVGADAAPAFAAGAMITTQAYTQHTMITPLTFPQATGGNDPLTYTLTTMGSLLGLTFNAAARPPTLTGTPNIFGVRDLVYKVTDADSNTATGDTATLPFRITVAESETALNFPTAIGVGAQPAGSDVRLYYLLGQAITPITFPTATGGTGPYTYETVSGAPPPELTFDGSVRVLAGTPTAPGRSTFTYRVTDSATPAAMADVSVTMVICENGGATDGATVCPVPTFVTLNLPTPADQVFINIRPITPLTLPAATGGTGTNPVRIYTATPLPAGLSFNPASRVISGRPEAESTTTTTVNYRVGDAGQGNADTQSTTVTFDIVVGDRLILIDPTTETFTVGETVAYTLPVAQRGTPPFTYTLTMTDGGALTLPAGLTWNMGVTPQTITGIPTTPTPETGYNYTVTDSLGLSTSGSFDFTVNADTAPAFAEGAMILAQLYSLNTMITPLTFPQATGGDGALTYTLTPALPAGLTFDAAARPPTLTGTPTAAQTNVGFTYRVTDGDGNTADDTDSLIMTLGVSVGQSLLTFPFAVGIGALPNSGTIELYYPLGQPITPVTFPAVSGGTAPYTYSTSSGTLPVGLTFDADFRILSGTPIAAGGSRFNYRVTDSSTTPDTSFLTTQITICESGGAADGATACTAPTFVALSFPTPPGPPDDQAFTSGATITPLTLPAATGGTGANPVRIYTATPLPAGLTFDPVSRAITGMPTRAGTTIVSYRVGDAGQGNADTQSTTVTFNIVVEAPDTAPAFATGAMIPVQRYVVGTMITTLNLPEATGGNGALTYTLSPAPLPGLTFDAVARPPTLTGTPTEQVGGPRGVAFTYTVTDGDGNTADSDTDSLAFTLEVSSAGRSSLAFPRTTGLGTAPNSGTIRLFYPLNQPITPATFPAAGGGTDSLHLLHGDWLGAGRADL